MTNRFKRIAESKKEETIEPFLENSATLVTNDISVELDISEGNKEETKQKQITVYPSDNDKLAD